MKTDNPARTRKGSENMGETWSFRNRGPAGGPLEPNSELARVVAAWECLDQESRMEILTIVAKSLASSEML
jgi:hypothetical protein